MRYAGAPSRQALSIRLAVLELLGHVVAREQSPGGCHLCDGRLVVTEFAQDLGAVLAETWKIHQLLSDFQVNKKELKAQKIFIFVALPQV